MATKNFLHCLATRLTRHRRWYARVLCALALLAASGWLLDRVYPLPLPTAERGFSRVVVASDGTPLRAFADDQGIWRYPVAPADVSPNYLQALIHYEDRYFRRHPGVNPVSLLRAAWQWALHRRVISGGSTLTMQVARFIDPHPRSVRGKLEQVLRALQLEWHLSKEGILAYYLNHAPFGGPIEGVEAASYAYLGKSAAELSHAEAALLAVLPQAPSRLRPDRHPARARRARDKVLRRLESFGVWSPEVVADALQENIDARLHPPPLIAPLLARRLEGQLPPVKTRRTTIDIHLQRSIEARLTGLSGELPSRTSVAILVVENRTLTVRAYVGSLDFGDSSRFGHVDMVRAVRSPGSTLKPFLYAFALEEGLIHSESLLADVPSSFGGYRPANFTGGFQGPVGVSEALRRSLNVPAVQVLDHLTPAAFASRLMQGGIALHFPNGARSNLAMILGGVGTTLEDLVSAYAAFGRGGLGGKLRYFEDQVTSERYLMDPGAAWIVGEILRSQPRPGLQHTPLLVPEGRRVAWKTGTSYGYRDAWAIGASPAHTIGVWVGRPDATPLPGHYGAVTAAPILFSLFDMLASRRPMVESTERPASVARTEICLPLGTPPEPGKSSLCHLRRTAWTLHGLVPPTLPDRQIEDMRSARVKIWVNPRTGRRLSSGCHVAERQSLEIARWPVRLLPWLGRELRARSAVPPYDEACIEARSSSEEPVRITGLDDGTVLRRAGVNGARPTASLNVLGGRGEVHWMVNGRVERSIGADLPFRYRFESPGRYRITALDEFGSHHSITVRVQ